MHWSPKSRGNCLIAERERYLPDSGQEIEGKGAALGGVVQGESGHACHTPGHHPAVGPTEGQSLLQVHWKVAHRRQGEKYGHLVVFKSGDKIDCRWQVTGGSRKQRGSGEL